MRSSARLSDKVLPDKMKSTVFFILSLLFILQNQASGGGFRGDGQNPLEGLKSKFPNRPRNHRHFGHHKRVESGVESVGGGEPSGVDAGTEMKFAVAESSVFATEDRTQNRPNEDINESVGVNRGHRREHFESFHKHKERNSDGGFGFSKKKTVHIQHEHMQ